MRPLLLAACLTLAPTLALADRIDGDWCSASGKHVAIDGPKLTTPGGQESTGTYQRHAFDFAVPEGESDAGTEVRMRQLGETSVQVWFGDAEPEIWRRCEPIA